MFRPRRLSRRTRLSFAGLFVGIVGIVIQWLADPAKFANAQDSYGITFPPGIIFIAASGLLMLVTARWWWHPVFAVVIAFWIAVVGTLAGQLTPNLFAHNLGTVAGNVVMIAGLLFAGITGVLSMITERATRRATRDRLSSPARS
ncbi:MAG TPA: hypothetical protein VHW44_30960 [Pseudonocardiaceae bacterium]|jgi:hypothetical protein|nr:hypothetical protein [Pseudonocardiaceae bacterium]